MIKDHFIDEEIIALRQVYRKNEDIDITKSEVCIRGHWTGFVQIGLFEGRVTLLIPETFSELPEDIAKVRYNSIYRPPIILSSGNYSENLCFHLLKYDEPDLGDSIMQMQQAVLRNAPESVMYETGIVHSKQLDGRWFEYKNFTLNDETYNMQFLIKKDTSLLVGSFNCRMCFFDEWKPFVLQMLESVTII